MSVEITLQVIVQNHMGIVRLEILRLNHIAPHVTLYCHMQQPSISTENFIRFLDPIIFGDYPIEMYRVLASKLPTFTAEERRKLQNKLDFIGINHYSTVYVKDCMNSPCMVDRFDGNALVSTTAERNGVPIGSP
ncbi:uncharacterized protein A4U43_C04F1280, partial [Asparagus officinalis]